LSPCDTSAILAGGKSLALSACGSPAILANKSLALLACGS
jgi:hypothetical protein